MTTPPPPAELQYIAETAHATWALAIVTLVLAIGTLFFMWLQLRESKAASRVTLHLQLLNDFESEAMSRTRSRVASYLLRGQEPPPNWIESILDRLEGIALYLRRGMLERDLVWHDFSYYLRCYWHQLSGYVRKQRELRGDPTLFREIELLYEEFVEEEMKRRGTEASGMGIDETELQEFLKSESDISDRLPVPRLY